MKGIWASFFQVFFFQDDATLLEIFFSLKDKFLAVLYWTVWKGSLEEKDFLAEGKPKTKQLTNFPLLVLE